MAWIVSSLAVGGSHESGNGLKLSFLARIDTSELRRDLCSVGMKENVSNEATRLSDIFDGELHEAENQCKQRRPKRGGWKEEKGITKDGGALEAGHACRFAN